MSLPGESASGARAGDILNGAAALACGACGALPRRSRALYCSTCGRELSREYVPADSLRASYRFERPRETRGFKVEARGARPGLWRRPRRRVRPKGSGVETMPRRNSNGASTSALACVAYALVPYLGILFCPGALLFGGVGLVRSWRTPHAGGRRESALGLALGLLILCAQLVLWWILYKVPEWSRQANF
ncbi:MAG TPA: hypothetical protein VM936_00830 [Pyrinomonadaceae bacterium]|nr:hypothetical protein [Pyrinomonadaceae bacterium]